VGLHVWQGPACAFTFAGTHAPPFAFFPQLHAQISIHIAVCVLAVAPLPLHATTASPSVPS
jgi:hypothetical protein